MGIMCFSLPIDRCMRNVKPYVTIDNSIVLFKPGYNVFRAVRFGQLTVVAELLDAGAEIDSQDNEGLTPFLLAAKYNHLEIVHLLWDKGARVAAKDLKLKTALHHAVEKENVSVVQFLLDVCKKLIHAKDVASHTPVHYAARDDHIKVSVTSCLPLLTF